MTRDDAIGKYRRQRHGARLRGIDFRLTFEQWLEWWGDDLDRRGVGPDDLQMQRQGDSGAYEIGNIRKGTPRENAKTRGAIKRAAASKRAKELREAALDAAMFQPSVEQSPWRDMTEDECELNRMFNRSGLQRGPNSFLVDKR